MLSPCPVYLLAETDGFPGVTLQNRTDQGVPLGKRPTENGKSRRGSTAGNPDDALCGNLRGKAHGHDTVIADPHPVTDAKPAAQGVWTTTSRPMDKSHTSRLLSRTSMTVACMVILYHLPRPLYKDRVCGRAEDVRAGPAAGQLSGEGRMFRPILISRMARSTASASSGAAGRAPVPAAWPGYDAHRGGESQVVQRLQVFPQPARYSQDRMPRLPAWPATPATAFP